MKRPVIIAGIALALMAGSVSAKEYFKWVDEKGVTRYAETPPAGVTAEKVNTYAGSSTVYDPSKANSASEESLKESQHKAEIDKKSKQLEADEKAQCQKVNEQYKVLSERGRVRMKDKEGNERVLTPEEQTAKVLELEKYLKDMCGKK